MYKKTEEHKRKISETLKRKFANGELIPYFKDKHLTKEHKKNLSKNHRNQDRENHPMWKGGRRIKDNGYVTVRKSKGHVYEHRVIMEKSLGRKLESNEIVHHVNGDKIDNRIENLEIMTASDHAIHHGLGVSVGESR